MPFCENGSSTDPLFNFLEKIANDKLDHDNIIKDLYLSAFIFVVLLVWLFFTKYLFVILKLFNVQLNLNNETTYLNPVVQIEPPDRQNTSTIWLRNHKAALNSFHIPPLYLRLLKQFTIGVLFWLFCYPILSSKDIYKKGFETDEIPQLRLIYSYTLKLFSLVLIIIEQEMNYSNLKVVSYETLLLSIMLLVQAIYMTPQTYMENKLFYNSVIGVISFYLVLAFIPQYRQHQLEDEVCLGQLSESRFQQQYQNAPLNTSGYVSIPNRLLFLWCWNLIWISIRRPLQLYHLWPLNKPNCARSNCTRVKLNTQSFIPQFLYENPSVVMLIIANVVVLILIEYLGNSLNLLFVCNSQKYLLFVNISFMIVLDFLRTLCRKKTLEVSMRLHASVLIQIYNKSLRISPISQKKYSSGKLISLASIDSILILKLINLVINFIAIIFKIALNTYFLCMILQERIVFSFLVALTVVSWLPSLLILQKRITRELQQVRHQRIKLISDTLRSIKVIKMNGWEPNFKKKIDNYRNIELKWLKQRYYYDSVIALLMNICAYAMLFAGLFQTKENDMPAIFFMSIVFFKDMRNCIQCMPEILDIYFKYCVALDEICNFLNCEELAFDSIEYRDNLKRNDVILKNAVFSWKPMNHHLQGEHRIKPISFCFNLKVPKGSLIAIVGDIGSGKSTLLNSLLASLYRWSGEAKVNESISYCAQKVWITNGTVKENILMGSPYDEKKFRKVLKACALTDEIERLPNGVDTVIENNGFSLSGGQCQRVAIARAAYRSASLYLFDDPLSALDIHKSKHIFLRVLGQNGMLNGKTRILVTYQFYILPECDYIYVLGNQTITDEGTFSELCVRNQNEMFSNQKLETAYHTIELYNSMPYVFERKWFNLWLKKLKSPTRRKSTSFMFLTRQPRNSIASLKTFMHKKIVMEVSKVYFQSRNFIPQFGLWFCFICLFCTFGMIATEMGISQAKDINVLSVNYYFAVMGIVESFFSLGVSITLLTGLVQYYKQLHETMGDLLFQVPLDFFERTPPGQVLVHFAQNIQQCDEERIAGFHNVWKYGSRAVSCLIVFLLIEPLLTGIIIALSAIYFLAYRFVFVSLFKRLRVIQNETLAPLLSHFVDSISGFLTIRAFDTEKLFVEKTFDVVDRNNQANYARIIVEAIDTFYQAICNDLIVFLCFLLSNKIEHKARIFGYCKKFTYDTTRAVFESKRTIEADVEITECEEFIQSMKAQIKLEQSIFQMEPPAKWPSAGRIEFQNYTGRYAGRTRPALKNIDFVIKPGERIGIIGSSGSGKSSLIKALYGMMQRIQGKILIDGINIENLDKPMYRSRLTIIAQDVALFSDTLRFNLDPKGEHFDEELIGILEKVQMKSFLNSNGKGLDGYLDDDGMNLSSGQRQLICLARALLNHSKVLVLDEATANIDPKTQSIVQQVIEEQFKDSTILSVAHRVDSLLDYDRIIVIKDGRITSFDTPDKMLQDNGSLLNSMILENFASYSKKTASS